MEQILINALRMAPDKNIQAMLLEAYIQGYGPISDENGEIVRQILMERRYNYDRPQVNYYGKDADICVIDEHVAERSEQHG